MNEKPVIAVIIVLLCFCIPFGNGEASIEYGRHRLHHRYSMLSSSLKRQAFPFSRVIVFKYIKEVEDKKGEYQKWILRISGYSHEQLSSPPGSFNNKDVLKLATEYHLLKAGWYHERFRTLKRAAERDKEVNQSPYQKETYPSIYRCRRSALEADERSRIHMIKYSECYKALNEIERKYIMNGIKIPNSMALLELNHESAENKNGVDSGWKNHENSETQDILNIKTQLDHEITRLSNRKILVNSCAFPGVRCISSLLSPDGMKLRRNLMSELCNCFSVTDLSQPPDKASRGDLQFLEVAWLFNRYRSLWHEIRCILLKKFLRRGNHKAYMFDRIEEALNVENENFHRYEFLNKEYYETLSKYQPVKIVIAQNFAPAAASKEKDSRIDISADENFEPMQWSGIRKCTNSILQGSLQVAEHRLLDENTKSLVDGPVISERVTTGVNGRTEEEAVHTANRNKYHEEGFLQTELSQEHQCGPSDVDLSHDVEQNPLVMEAVQHGTIAVPIDLDPRLGLALGQAETEKKNDYPARTRLTLDLTLAPPGTEGEVCLIDAIPESSMDLVLCASKNKRPLQYEIDTGSIAPKRPKFTQSGEHHSQCCPSLDDVHQCFPEGSNKLETSSSCTLQFF